MKVLWIVLGVLFGCCLLCGGGGYFLFMKGKGVLDEASKFGSDSLQTIATNYSPEDFAKVAPQAVKDNSPEKINDFLNLLKEKLGPVKGPIEGHITNINAHNNNGDSTVSADWNADATFEKGTGQVTMQLESHNGKWEVLKFDVKSEALKAGSKNDVQ